MKNKDGPGAAMAGVGDGLGTSPTASSSINSAIIGNSVVSPADILRRRADEVYAQQQQRHDSSHTAMKMEPSDDLIPSPPHATPTPSTSTIVPAGISEVVKRSTAGFFTSFLFEGSPSYKQRRKKNKAGKKRLASGSSAQDDDFVEHPAQTTPQLDHAFPEPHPSDLLDNDLLGGSQSHNPYQLRIQTQIGGHLDQQLGHHSYPLQHQQPRQSRGHHPSISPVEISPPSSHASIPLSASGPLSAHLSSAGSHSSKLKAYVCPMHSCRLMFRRQEHFIRHVRTQHRRDKRKTGSFECERCQKRFSREDVLTQHMRVHASLDGHSPSTIQGHGPSPTNYGDASHNTVELTDSGEEEMYDFMDTMGSSIEMMAPVELPSGQVIYEDDHGSESSTGGIVSPVSSYRMQHHGYEQHQMLPHQPQPAPYFATHPSHVPQPTTSPVGPYYVNNHPMTSTLGATTNLTSTTEPGSPYIQTPDLNMGMMGSGGPWRSAPTIGAHNDWGYGPTHHGGYISTATPSMNAISPCLPNYPAHGGLHQHDHPHEYQSQHQPPAHPSAPQHLQVGIPPYASSTDLHSSSAYGRAPSSAPPHVAVFDHAGMYTTAVTQYPVANTESLSPPGGMGVRRHHSASPALAFKEGGGSFMVPSAPGSMSRKSMDSLGGSASLEGSSSRPNTGSATGGDSYGPITSSPGQISGSPDNIASYHAHQQHLPPHQSSGYLHQYVDLDVAPEDPLKEAYHYMAHGQPAGGYTGYSHGQQNQAQTTTQHSLVL